MNKYTISKRRGIIFSVSVNDIYFFLFSLSDKAAHSASNKESGSFFSILEIIFIFELFKLPQHDKILDQETEIIMPIKQKRKHITNSAFFPKSNVQKTPIMAIKAELIEI